MSGWLASWLAGWLFIKNALLDKQVASHYKFHKFQHEKQKT